MQCMPSLDLLFNLRVRHSGRLPGSQIRIFMQYLINGGVKRVLLAQLGLSSMLMLSLKALQFSFRKVLHRKMGMVLLKVNTLLIAG